MTRRASKKADLVIVQSSEMKEVVQAYFGLDPNRVAVATPSVAIAAAVAGEPREALAAMESVPADRRLLYVGNDRPHKNVRVAIAGMAAIRSLVPDATLFLTWPVDHPAAKAEGVVCLGSVPHSQVGELYARATALVQPSLAETVGLPMLEAMVHGVPVIASDRPFAHVICGDAAVFFDPHQPAEFANTALEIIADDALRSELSRKGSALTAALKARQPYARIVDWLTDIANLGPPAT